MEWDWLQIDTHEAGLLLREPVYRKYTITQGWKDILLLRAFPWIPKPRHGPLKETEQGTSVKNK